MKEKTSNISKKAAPKRRKNSHSSAAPPALVNQGRHEAQCTVCKHPQREEIEQEFISWKSPEKIGETYGLSRDSIYRHARALNLIEPRRRNVRYALERIIERAGDVEVNANAIVSEGSRRPERERVVSSVPSSIPSSYARTEMPARNGKPCD